MKLFTCKKITKIVAAVLTVCLAVCLFTGCSGETDYSKVDPPVVTMVIKDYGTITLELYPQYAPETVKNFISLANSGFYDGLTFHRVIEGFMIQGGDPEGTGGGGPGYSIKGEFSSNGFTQNTLTHERGVISMARSRAMDSASSQFFICHADSPHLDGQYAAFGMVTDGMDVVDEIAEAPTDYNDKPIENQVIKTIRLV